MPPDWTHAVARVAIVMLASASLTQAQAAKEMAVTFDDLPFAYAGTLTGEEQRDAVAHILTALDTHGVIATGFVIGRSVTDA